MPVLSAQSVPNPVKAKRSAIRLCQREDLARIAEIHKAQFAMPGALLGHISTALIAALYAAFLDRTIFLVHTTGGEVDGFVLGGPSRVVTRCRLSFLCTNALACIMDIAWRPQLWYLTFRAVVRLLRKQFSSLAPVSPDEDFRLLSIAVAASAARKGVGTALVAAFEETIRKKCRTYGLHVLKTNVAAIRFYEKLSFQCVGETASVWTLRKELAEGSRFTA